MKKLFTLALGIALVASTQAKTIYVAPDAVFIGVSGTSWNAPTTLKTAIEGAATTDSIFVKAGTYGIDPISTSSTTSYATTMIWIASGRFILGGFAGTEANSAQRVKSDLDMNGITEPWEYTNQTIFDGQGKYMVMNIAGGTNLIDGIVLQNGYASLYHYNYAGGSTLSSNNVFVTKDGAGNKVLSGASATAAGTSTFSSAGLKIGSTGGVFKNIIVRNNTITTKDYEGPYGTGVAGSLVLGDGNGVPAVVNNPSCAVGLTLTNATATVSNFLVENNVFDFVVSDAFKANAYVNNYTTTAGVASAPTFTNTTGAGVYASTGTIKNSIIRNNLTKAYGYTTTTSGKTAETATHGGGVYINNAASNLYNCIIANNEIKAFNIASSDNVAGGGLYADNAGNVYNCTFVNNKISSYNTTTSTFYTTTGYGGGAFFKSASSGAIILKSYNNVFWNNSAGGATDINRANLALRNNSTSSPATMLIDVQNNVIETAPYWYGNASSSVTTQTGSNSVANFLNCKIDLSTSNADATKGSNFVSPSAVVGCSSIASDIKANWSIGVSSYLLASGSAAITGYTPSTDFSGRGFASTPAVGAYEFGTSTAISNVLANSSDLLIKKDVITTTSIVASINVYSLTGAIVAQGLKTNSVSIAHLPAGVYIVVAGAEKVKFVK